MTIRPMGSLTPTLLARKGAARPAMRPQIQPMRTFQENARQLDDLGWNDMGTDAPPPAPEAVVPAAPAPVAAPVVETPAEVVEITPAVELAPAAVSQVAELQKKIAEHVSQAPKARAPKVAVSKEQAKSRRSALSDGRRAAFTLRLDGERHLKLRLACVTSNRSAQQIVTEALDRLIAELPDVADLAAKVRKGR